MHLCRMVLCYGRNVSEIQVCISCCINRFVFPVYLRSKYKYMIKVSLSISSAQMACAKNQCAQHVLGEVSSKYEEIDKNLAC